MKCTPFVRWYDILSNEWGVYYAKRDTNPEPALHTPNCVDFIQIISPLVSQIHQNFFFFMIQRQTNTTATLMTMTAG